MYVTHDPICGFEFDNAVANNLNYNDLDLEEELVCCHAVSSARGWLELQALTRSRPGYTCDNNSNWVGA